MNKTLEKVLKETIVNLENCDFSNFQNVTLFGNEKTKKVHQTPDLPNLDEKEKLIELLSMTNLLMHRGESKKSSFLLRISKINNNKVYVELQSYDDVIKHVYEKEGNTLKLTNEKYSFDGVEKYEAFREYLHI